MHACFFTLSVIMCVCEKKMVRKLTEKNIVLKGQRWQGRAATAAAMAAETATVTATATASDGCRDGCSHGFSDGCSLGCGDG